MLLSTLSGASRGPWSSPYLLPPCFRLLCDALGSFAFSVAFPASSVDKMTPAGLEPAIPGSVGRCLIHWATGPDAKSSTLLAGQPYRGSHTSLFAFFCYFSSFALLQGSSENASAGNRTRVTSMATMYSTTRPLMLLSSALVAAAF